MTSPPLKFTSPCVCGKADCPIAHGQCHCGCGKTTTLLHGKPQRFSKGHKGHRLRDNNSPAAVQRRKILSGELCPCGDPGCRVQYGTCHCGCSESTLIVTSKQANSRWKCYVGKPMLYIHNHHMRLNAEPYKVEDRGHTTPCWIWQRSTSYKGYGHKGKGNGEVGLVATHIWYWEQKNGPVPEGLQLDHLCRQRACCNPDHLEPVTNAVNCQRGDMATITPEVVMSIRAKVASGNRQCDVARELGVSSAIVNQIIKGRTWRNV